MLDPLPISLSPPSTRAPRPSRATPVRAPRLPATSLPRGLDALFATLDAAPRLTERVIGAALDTVVLSSADAVGLAPFDVAAYGRTRLRVTDRYEVLILTWLPGQVSAPHDHDGSCSGVRVVAGVLLETMFSLGDDGLVDARERRRFPAGETTVGDDATIHMLAPSGGALVTLHVYAPRAERFTVYVARSGEVSRG